MPKQTFYTPSGGRKKDDSPYSDDNGWQPNHDFRRSSGLSQQAGNKINDIDSLLAENESNPPIVGNDLRGRADKPSKSADSAGELNNKENQTDDTVGKGWRPKMRSQKQQTKFDKALSGNSKLKKRIAIAGAAAGGSMILGVVVFFALLPLKIEHIVSNLATKEGAAASAAVGTEVENEVSGYIKGPLIASINSGKCHKTVDPSCHVVTSGTGPFGSLYSAWSKTKFENKLAKDYGIILGKSADGKFFVNIKGQDVGNTDQLRKLQDPKDPTTLFDLDGTKEISRNELRATLRDAIKGGTLWDRTYGRFKLGKYLEKNFGIKRCMIACKVKDKFADSVADKKLTAKALLFQRLVPDKYGVIMACISQPATCDQTLGNAEPGEGERVTQGQQKIRSILSDASSHFTDSQLKDLVKVANDGAKDGFAKTIVSKGTETLIAKLFGEEAGKTAGQAATKAVPIVGWVLLAAQLHAIGDGLGDMVKWTDYADNSASAVELFTSYQTVASEMKSGHVDPTEVGSFTQALNTNLSGSKDDKSDATSTPLYATMMGGGTVTNASIFSSIFSSVSADSLSQSGPYKCPDGKGVPTGKRVCADEVLGQGNAIADNIQSFMHSLDQIPFLSIAFDILNGINELIGDAFSTAFHGACYGTLSPGKYVGCPQAVGGISSLMGDFFSWIGNQLIVTPFTKDMSGGRTFDMMAAGADVANNNNCRDELGCSQISDAQVASIQNQQLAEQKQDFNSQSMFARIFSTDSSYSLVSRLAMNMPTNLLTATSGGVASIAQNPLGRIASGFSSLFSGNHAFAATPPQEDPFGIAQYGYTKLPSNPESFWEANCKQGPLAIYDDGTKQLDISPWLNNDKSYTVTSGTVVDFTSSNFDGKAGQTNTKQDTDTGEQLNLRSNPCPLILSSIQAAGAFSDPTLLPSDSLNGDNGSSSTTTSTISGDAASLAKQVLANPNITLSANSKADLTAVSQGQKVTPGPIGNGSSGLPGCSARTPTDINAGLIKTMLAIAQKYKYQINDIVSGHDCDTGKHPQGRAMDIFYIAGQPLNDSWWSSGSNVATINDIGNIVQGSETYQFGFGVGCTAVSKIQSHSNLVVFNDSCGPQDEIHIDVRGAP